MYNGTIAIAGEFMGTRPFSMHDEPEFLEWVRILREADTAYCHLEMNLNNKETYAGRAFSDTALQADPIIARDLKWAGFDLVSCAFNHTLDWGLQGLSGTIEALDKAGLVHAGTGFNLEEAREPAYFESRGGRVAVISISSGHHPYDSAGPSKPPVPGRPGVNPLRVNLKYVVEQDRLEKLKEIWKAVGLSTKWRHVTPLDEGDVCFNVGQYRGGSSEFVFRAGEKPGIVSIPSPWDVEGNLRAVRDARRQADLVIVCHHAHVNDGQEDERPSLFIPPFAKQCIDAGADLFIGHGSHKPLGIEMYKNRPIFYGTGNFFTQSLFLKRLPADTYESHGFSLDDLSKVTPADLLDSREKQLAPRKRQFESAISVLGMSGGRFREMKLYPLSLGYDQGPQGKEIRKTGARIEARPVRADVEEGEKIIGHIKRLSETYGTRIEIKDGIGLLEIE